MVTKQNERLITLINRLCAVEEWAREVSGTVNPLFAGFSADQKRKLAGLEKALSDLDKVRGVER